MKKITESKDKKKRNLQIYRPTIYHEFLDIFQSFGVAKIEKHDQIKN